MDWEIRKDNKPYNFNCRLELEAYCHVYLTTGIS